MSKLVCRHWMGPAVRMCEGVVSRGGASSVDVRVYRKLVSCNGMGPAMWMCEGVVSCVVMGWDQQCGCVRVS